MKHSPDDVSRETSIKLTEYVDILYRWNRRINLISPGDIADVAERHVFDALQLRDLLPNDVDRALDVGSGAGFPGLILAMATATHFTLVESDARKCAFLREAGRLLAAPIEVVNARIEHCSFKPFRVITARALAPLPRLLDLCVPHLATDGILIFPKGRAVDAEIREAETGWKMTIEKYPSLSSEHGTILRIGAISRA